MSSYLAINWLALSFSLLNAILLLWLGLTVMLNSEHRVWGVWVASSSLILAAVFFNSHTIILHRGLLYTDWQFTFWWKAGIIPAYLLPYTWYVVMLWYTGYWISPTSDLRHRHRWWIRLLTVAVTIGLLILIVFPSSMIPLRSTGYDPSYLPQARQALRLIVAFLGGAFVLYITSCMLLSLDAVRQPGPSARLMGEAARMRARPWLVASTVAMLLVTLLVTWLMIWVVINVLDSTGYRFTAATFDRLAIFDLIIVGLLTLAIVCIGQAAVSYEVFTGRMLPRRGLRLNWERMLWLATLSSTFLAAMLVFEIPLVHGLIFMMVVLTCFAAAVGWRAFIERENTINSLRPFITSQRLYENLLFESTTQGTDLRPAFDTLCRNLLETTVAYLLPVGPLTTIVQSPLTYPTERALPHISRLTRRFDSPKDAAVPLDPDQYEGARWAIPLWNESGLIGIFLLGERLDGGLYTKEEMDVARASGERLIDTLASAEISRRLMALQRQRMVETQLIDQQTRRVLHDDVLPLLHTAMLSLTADGQSSSAVGILTDAHRQISDLLREMPQLAVAPVAKYGLLNALQRLVEVEMAAAFDRVSWQVAEMASMPIAQIPPVTADVVYYAAREAMRNAAKHGRGNNGRDLTLTVTVVWDKGLRVIIEDDGVGLAYESHSLKLNTGGSGQGLKLHSTMLAVVGGQLTLESIPERLTRVVLWLPVTETTKSPHTENGHTPAAHAVA